MKIAVVFGARSNEIRSRLMQLQDNLYIDAFATVGDMVSSSVTRKYFYDRVVMISNAVNATGGQATIDDLCSYWRAHCQRTQLVMVCRAETDDELAKYFTSAFGSPLVTSMSVKSTSVMTLKEAAIEDIRELNSKYGIVFDTLAIVDEDAYEEPEPEPMPQENAMQQAGQEGVEQGVPSEMMSGEQAVETEQSTQGMPVSVEQSAPVKKKGLFGKLFGGGKKDHKNNKHQNNIPQSNQGIPAEATMPGMSGAVAGASEGMTAMQTGEMGMQNQMYAGQTGYPEQSNQGIPYGDDPMAAQFNEMSDESNAFPEQNFADQPQNDFSQGEISMPMPEQQGFAPNFDPETGAPLNQAAKEQAFTPKFDEETGEPLTGYSQQDVSINPEEHQFEGAYDESESFGGFEQSSDDFANQGTFDEQPEQTAFNQADFSVDKDTKMASSDMGMQEMPENMENQEFSDFSDNTFDTPTSTETFGESGTDDTSSNDAFFDDFEGVDSATHAEDEGFGIEEESAEDAFGDENSKINDGFASLDGTPNMGEKFGETPVSEGDFASSFEQENNEVAPEMSNFDDTDTANIAGENTFVGEDNFSMSGNNFDPNTGMPIGGAVNTEPTDEELIAQGFKFHPETGRPLVAAATAQTVASHQPQYKFDPETGRPLSADASVHGNMNQMAHEVPQQTMQGMSIPNEEVVEDFSGMGMSTDNNFGVGMQEQQDDVDTDFSDMSVGDLEASYREKLEQPKVQIVEKEVIKEVVKEVKVGGKGSNSVYGSILKGKTKKIILVTGDRGSGVTSLAYEIAEWFAKYVPVLYFDCDVELHGLLSYIDYHDFCQYDQQQLQGVKLCRSAKAFPNCITRYSSNLDLLTTNYGAEVSNEELELAQSVVAEVANNYGIVVVDAPIDKLPYLTDLILCGNACLLAEANKRGMMNIMCKLEDSPLPTRYKRNLAGTGTMVYTKVNPKINMKKLIDYVKDIVDFEEVNWVGMNTINRPAKLDQKFIEEIIEG